ncbi:DNA polymerase III subunit beta, partial [Candidatus Uhrbacteria bacterium]|nr:DNA polymerase III subunit beta [Candidatus Uhrbacteria bacterium]
ISTTQENLHQSLSLVSRITSRNLTLPILQNVLIKAQNGVLRLSTTNLEIAMSCMVRGKVEEEGEFTAPAKLFSDYISLLPPGKVQMNLKGNNLIITSEHSETKINGISANEFPVIPRVAEGKVFILDSLFLSQTLQTVLFAVAQTESRPELTGVFFSFQPSPDGFRLVLAATDSYRLAEIYLPVAKTAETNPCSLIIPARTLLEFVRMATAPRGGMEEAETVTITVTENQVQFELGNSELQSRIIEGTYPDYRQIIPSQFKTESTLSRAEFTAAIRAASLFTKSGLSDIRLEFEPAKPVTLRAADSQTGEHTAEISGQVSGIPNAMVVNYRYLLDGLQAMADDEIVFKMIDASNPCLITPKDANESYLYLVMPIKQ